MKIAIARSAHDAILAHCARSPDREACGLLCGRPRHIAHAIPAANVAERPEDSFEIDPAALFQAIRAERAGDYSLLGHYHSHPNGAADPSPRDAAMALDRGRIWVIVAKDEMSAWHVDEPGQFSAVELCLASVAGEGQ